AADFGRQCLLQRNVAHGQASTGFEYPGDFLEDCRFIGCEINDAVTDHAVDGIIRQREFVDSGQMKFDICEWLAVVSSRRIAASQINHFGCHVDANRPPVRADFGAGEEYVESTAAA